MKRVLRIPILLAFLLACTPESDQVTFGISAMSFANSEWSAPVNLGATINSAANDFGPALSKDGLSLYFQSNRPGGAGGQDIWIAQRACLDCPWGAPVNAGPPLNTLGADQGPTFSIDGHILIFVSDRPGGQGLADLWMSRRADPTDDFGWGTPVNLGPAVNTAASEAGPEYFATAEEGTANLYFNRAPAGGTTDIYYASVARDGSTRGSSVLVSELSDPAANDQGSTLRIDGREVLFFSNRAGGLGGNDLYIAIRRSVHDAWFTPVNLGLLNSPASDQNPSLSTDGRTLLFASTRPGGSGGNDIWMSTRTPSGH